MVFLVESGPTQGLGKVITYRVLDLPGPGAGDCTFTLWIDAETLLPLKRLLASEGNEREPGAITRSAT